MDVSKFNEKLNKLDGKTYVIEEIVTPVNGIYEAELIHDNVNLTTLNVYTGSKLTGDKVNTYTTSTPSLTPWKIVIKIFSNVTPLYISYETSGDTIEAEDINNIQDAVVDTQENLNNEIDRATNRENVINDDLNSETTRAKNAEQAIANDLNGEIIRAKAAEKILTDNLNSEINRSSNAEGALTNNLNTEISRSKGAENTLTSNLNLEITRASNAENTLTNNLNSEITRAKAAENTLTNTINTNKPTWDDKYTKNEVDNKISQVVSNMDWKEAVATYADIATTYPIPDDGWTVNVKDTDNTYRYSGSAWIPISANSIPLASSSVDGKMSKQDKIDHDDMNSKKHTHGNKNIIDIITQTLLDNWNAAYTHISDAVKHITSTERTLWNTVSNKSDTGHTHTSSNVTDFLATVRSTVLTGLSTATNSAIGVTDTVLGALGKLQAQITANLNSLTSHTGNTSNPHSTTASQIGLGNLTNDAQVKRSEMGIASGVATLDSLGVNNQMPKSHIHDDRYYTETESDNKFATKNEISNAGYGDMIKSVYDTSNNGIVDNAETAIKLATARTINSVSFDGSGNIVVPTIYDSSYKSIINPSGAIYNANLATATGAIAITLPVGMTNTMLRMTIRVYEYSTNESFDIYCGGYNYSSGNTWANNPFAYIVGNPSIDRRFNVRFGYTSGGKAVVYIGEINSTWAYPQVVVTDVQCGYGGQSINYTNGWSVGFSTTFENVTATISNCQVGYAISTNTANTTVLRDASGNFSAGTITASLSGNSSTATKLQTARTINGVSFDGSVNITIADNTKVPKGCTWNDLEGV